VAAPPLIPGPRPFLVEITLQSLAESFAAGYITAEELEQGREWILNLYAMTALRQGAGEC
jgi:hypothetical protein